MDGEEEAEWQTERPSALTSVQSLGAGRSLCSKHLAQVCSCRPSLENRSATPSFHTHVLVLNSGLRNGILKVQIWFEEWARKYKLASH